MKILENKSNKITKNKLNRVQDGDLGLILWENDATGSRKVSRYLPGLREAMNKYKKKYGIFAILIFSIKT